jgi:LysR family glycine cleavage system transcriptional activator
MGFAAPQQPAWSSRRLDEPNLTPLISHLPLSALRGFEAVARLGSFRKAAEELHVTPAAVSQQIKVLEQQLGHPLFHRLATGLALTRAGKIGLPLVREGLSSLESAAQLMAAQRGPDTLTVWTAPSFATKWLMPRLHHFVDAHPGIDLRLSASALLIEGARSSGVISSDDLRLHGVDVAIRFGRGQYPGCRVEMLLPVSVVPLCSPKLMEGEHPLREPADLRDQTLLHDDTAYEGRPDWASWLELAGVRDVDPSHGMRFNHSALALDAAADGQGVALTLLPLAATDLASGRLVVPFTQSVELDAAYYMISLPTVGEDEAPQIAAFRNWLLAEAQREQ